jgi:plastocyanin
MDSLREVTSPTVIHTVFVGQGGFSFDPQSVNITAGDTVHWVWSSGGHTVTSGSSCAANSQFCSPSNTNCSSGPTSGSGATYDHAFPTGGSFPYFCRPHCTFMTGVVNVNANILEATDLRVRPWPDPTLTSVTYTPACGATSHGIYIGKSSTYSPIAGLNWIDSACTDASGAALINTGPPPALTYLVIVGQDATHEGSYGKNSQGIERPEASGIGSCDRPRMISTACP